MTAKELAIAYDVSVPHDVSVPRLAQMIEDAGCRTLEDVRRMLWTHGTDTSEVRPTAAK